MLWVYRLVGAASFGAVSSMARINFFVALGLFAIAYTVGCLVGAKIGEEFEE